MPVTMPVLFIRPRLVCKWAGRHSSEIEPLNLGFAEGHRWTTASLRAFFKNDMRHGGGDSFDMRHGGGDTEAALLSQAQWLRCSLTTSQAQSDWDVLWRAWDVNHSDWDVLWRVLHRGRYTGTKGMFEENTFLSAHQQQRLIAFSGTAIHSIAACPWVSTSGRASPSISNVHANAACHSNAKPVKATARSAENT